MMEPSTLKLIHDEIDNVNSLADSKKLRILLEKDESAKQYFLEIMALSEELQGLGSIEPPDSLKKDIMFSVENVSNSPIIPVKPNSQGRELTGAELLRQKIYPFALGLAAGLACIMLFKNTISNDQLLNQDSAAGSIVRSEDTTVLEPLISEPYALSGNVRYFCGPEGNTLFADIPEQSVFQVVFKPKSIHLTAVASPTRTPFDISTSDTSILISTLESGPISISFDPLPGVTDILHITISSASDMWQKDIPIGILNNRNRKTDNK
ncbi:MAG: hypothetical protein SGI97_10745 [candidate division Zixibacteria bacterium]|nr:hypothetical protein [candidate division Zixibacteria bacterium]